MLVSCGLLVHLCHWDSVAFRALNLLGMLSQMQLFLYFAIYWITLLAISPPLTLSLLDHNRLLVGIDNWRRHSWIKLLIHWYTLRYIDWFRYINILSGTLRVNWVRILILGFYTIHKSGGVTHQYLSVRLDVDRLLRIHDYLINKSHHQHWP